MSERIESDEPTEHNGCLVLTHKYEILALSVIYYDGKPWMLKQAVEVEPMHSVEWVQKDASQPNSAVTTLPDNKNAS